MATVGVLMVRVWDAGYGEIMAMVGVLGHVEFLVDSEGHGSWPWPWLQTFRLYSRKLPFPLCYTLHIFSPVSYFG